MNITQYLENNYLHKSLWIEITKLNCSNSSITSLEGIQYLTNLKVLDISGNHIENRNGIQYLTNLEIIYN